MQAKRGRRKPGVHVDRRTLMLIELGRVMLEDYQFGALDAARRARALLPRCSPDARPVLEWASRAPEIIRGVVMDLAGLAQCGTEGLQYRMDVEVMPE